MLNLQTNSRLDIGFQKLNYYAKGNRLIHSTKHSKDNQMQSLKTPTEYPSC